VRERDLRHLERQGLIHRVPLDAQDCAVVLTDRGRGLLEHHRHRERSESGHRQTFYRGADKPRERAHDAQLYRAYLREWLRDQDARILRVQLDRELKREYQRCLQARNQGDRDSDGRPDRPSATTTRPTPRSWPPRGSWTLAELSRVFQDPTSQDLRTRPPSPLKTTPNYWMI
jgi:hypothetical protein